MSDPTQDDITRANLEGVREALIARGGAVSVAASLNAVVSEDVALDPETMQLVRLAALAATGAPAAAWEINLELVDGLGIDPEKVLGALLVIAPIIGTARFLEAAEHIGA